MSSAHMNFTAVYEPVENGWVQARLVELPEVITAAPSQAEAEKLLIDALREYLMSFSDRGEPAPIGEDARTARLDLTIAT